MADKTSFRELSQSIQHIDILRDMPDLAEDEREEMRQYIEDLTHRQADKLDNIISLLKDCDRRVEILDKEEKEIKAAQKKKYKELVQIAKKSPQLIKVVGTGKDAKMPKQNNFVILPNPEIEIVYPEVSMPVFHMPEIAML